MVQAHYASYVYAELLKEKSNDPHNPDHLIVLFLELDNKKAHAERKAFSIAQARQLHKDLGDLLEQLDNPNGFQEYKEWSPE